MSKSGFILYGARGKVGNIVAQKSRGGHIIREYVAPSNPKTLEQVKHRALFAGSVMFYHHALQNLFKFGFEDKKNTESDYNAFIRHNIKSAVSVTKGMEQDLYAPAIGDYMLTYGTLNANFTPEITDKGVATLNLGAGTTAYTKISELSAALIAQYPALANGDFITFVKIMTSAKELAITNDSGVVGFNYNEDFKGIAPIWSIEQIKLDTTNDDLISDTINATCEVSGTDVILKFNTQYEYASDVICACAVIASRKGTDSLLVSTEMIQWSPLGTAAITLGKTDDYTEAVASEWGYNTAILKGSLVV